MRALLFLTLFSCAPRTVEVLEPSTSTPPGPGYPMHVVVPQWMRPAVLCVAERRPERPEFGGGTWHCPVTKDRQ